MDRTEPSEAADRPPTSSRQQGSDEALRQSEGSRRTSDEAFRLLGSEITEYAISRLDPAGRVVSWNKGAGRIKGYAEDEIVGRHFSAFYVEEDAETGLPEEALRAAREKGQWTGEGWRVRKDGERFWAHVTITALRGEKDELRGFVKIIRDMTERYEHEEKLRESQEALRASERRYRRLFEEAQEGIAITTLAGEILDVNLAALDMLGYSREELLAMNAADLYIDPEERRRAIEEKGDQDAARNLEMRLRRKDGREMVAQVSVTVRRGPDGEIETFQTFFRDVTDRRRAEAALRESEERFRMLVEEALVGIYLVQDGAYEYVNPAYARMYGCTPRKMIGQSPMRFLHPSERDRAQRKVRLRMSGESDVGRGVYRARKESGETFFIDVNGARITYRGRPAILGMAVDVTERRRLQREVLSVQEEERQRLGQDLHDGVASHFFGVQMMLSALRRKVDEDEELHPQVQEIQMLVEKGTEDIRRLSRGLNPAGLTEGGLPLALGRLAENIEGGRFERAADLSRLSKETAAHLYWIAQEAVVNAQRYAGADRITIRLRNEDSALVLEVEDDGQGFEAERIEADGLGLRTMRYRAELLGAAFAVDSAPGEGTHVHCHLPV